jgi:hypothetical protein
MALNLGERERLEAYLLRQRVPATVLRARHVTLAREFPDLVHRGHGSIRAPRFGGSA